VEKISLAVNNYFASLESGIAEVATEEAVAEGEPLPEEAAAEPGAAATDEISADSAPAPEAVPESELSAHATEPESEHGPAPETTES